MGLAAVVLGFFCCRARRGLELTNDEQPAPASPTHDSVEVFVGGRLKVSREHGAEGVAHEPNSCALEDLVILVPASHCGQEVRDLD